MKKTKYFLIALVFSFFIFSFYYYGIDGMLYSGKALVYKSERNVSFPEFRAYKIKSIYNYAPFRKFEFSEKRAIVVFDDYHENGFDTNEISVLLKEIADANGEAEFADSKESFLNSLKYADSVAIISPGSAYDDEEKRALSEFADKGGRILIIADPGKNSMGFANSLSLDFGISFNDDYIYNLKENAGNFRYVIFTEFGNSALMQDVDELVFFVACSISSDNNIAYADENTKSSLGIANPSPVALIASKILAICDQSFLSESYSRAGDNRKFISNIAGFLAGSERRFYLSDFPEMYHKKHVKIIYLNESLLEKAMEIKSYLQSYGIDAEVYNADVTGKNRIFIGTYSKLSAVLPEILKNDIIEIDGIALERNLSSILYLKDRDTYIAGNNEAEVSEIIDEVKSGGIYSRILRNNAAVIIHERKKREEKINETAWMEQREQIPGNFSGNLSSSL